MFKLSDLTKKASAGFKKPEVQKTLGNIGRVVGAVSPTAKMFQTAATKLKEYNAPPVQQLPPKIEQPKPAQPTSPYGAFNKQGQAPVEAQKRPVTPAPVLSGSTKTPVEAQKSYTLDQEKQIVQGILRSQTAGQELTSEQLDYISKKKTDQLFTGQDQLKEFGRVAGEREATFDLETQRLEKEKERIARERQASDISGLSRYTQNLEAQYKPIVARAQQQGAERLSTQERLLGATGALTGSIGVQATNQINQQVTDVMNSIEAEKQSKIELERARLSGASEEVIRGLSDQLRSRTQQSEQLKQDNVIALEGLKMEAQAAGNEQLISFLSQQQVETSMAGRKANDGISKGLGYLADESGAPILSADGNPIPYGAAVSAGAKILDTVQDPVTGQWFTTKQFSDGTVYAEPVVLGTPQNSEYSGDPNQNSLVATYTQIFNGSSYNAEGIDLAGKKGSAITSPIAGEVISAGNAGGWGNQVKVRDAQGQVHQFSHLDSIGVKVGDQINPLSFLGSMGNTGNVLKGDGTKPNAQELASGRGTHLDYTVYDTSGNKMPLSVAKAYAGIGETPFKDMPQQQSAFATNIEPDKSQQLTAWQQYQVQKDLYDTQTVNTEDQLEQAQKLDNSKSAKIVRGQAQLAESIQKVISFIETNGTPRYGANKSTLDVLSNDVATAYKEAKDLGALVGADWELVNAIAPKFSVPGAIGDFFQGRGQEAALSALYAGLETANSEHAKRYNELQRLYPAVDLSSYGTFQINTNTPYTDPFSVDGVRYQSAGNMTKTEIQDLLATEEGTEAALEAGLITKL